MSLANVRWGWSCSELVEYPHADRHPELRDARLAIAEVMKE
jgi:hypothetical protein